MEARGGRWEMLDVNAVGLSYPFQGAVALPHGLHPASPSSPAASQMPRILIGRGSRSGQVLEMASPKGLWKAPLCPVQRPMCGQLVPWHFQLLLSFRSLLRGWSTGQGQPSLPWHSAHSHAHHHLSGEEFFPRPGSTWVLQVNRLEVGQSHRFTWPIWT